MQTTQEKMNGLKVINNDNIQSSLIDLLRYQGNRKSRKTYNAH